VKTQNYSTQIATENLYQASEAAKVVRAGLFPTIGAAGIVALTAAPLSAAGMMGQLVPFLFPTNWYASAAANYTYDSQVMSYKTLVANQMNLAEDLYHFTLRDNKILKRLQGLAADLASRREVVEMRYRQGYAPKSDLTAMDDVIAKNDASIRALQTALTSEYASLSMGIGLSPRDGGIQGLVDSPEIDFTTLKPLDADALMADAKSSSLDIRMQLYLASAARDTTAEQEWSVINPSNWVSLDESIVHKVLIAKSTQHSVDLQIAQLEQTTELNVKTLVATYNQLLSDNIALIKQVNEHEQDLELTTAQYRSGVVSILAYRDAIESMIQLQANQITSQAAFADAKGKVDRLLWQGDYLSALELDIPKGFF
jgi:outer membrane protein TolC